jgi:ribonucleoside-diphosphate reductase alpha chain
MDTIATMTSIALQYGVPLKALVDKFSHTRFEPSGFTGNKQIPIAKSITDYVFRFLGNRYLETEDTTSAEVSDETGTTVPLSVHKESVGPDAAAATPPQAAGAIAGGSGDATTSASAASLNLVGSFVNQADAPSCMDCGSIMIRNGACYKCPNCGSTSGCS